MIFEYLIWPASSASQEVTLVEEKEPPVPLMEAYAFEETAAILTALESKLSLECRGFLRLGYARLFDPKLHTFDLPPAGKHAFSVLSPNSAQAVAKAMHDLIFAGLDEELEEIWKPEWEANESPEDFYCMLEDVVDGVDRAHEHGWGLQVSIG